MVRIVFKLLMALGLLLLLLQLLYGLAVRRYVDGLVSAAAPQLALHFERIEAFPPGRIGLRGVRVQAPDQPGFFLHAQRVLVRSDDHAWLLAWLFARTSGPGRDLDLRLEGVTASPALLAQWRERVGPAGLSLPFEGLACASGGRVLTPEDYTALGWDDSAWDLSLRVRHQPIERRLDLDWRIDRTPPAVILGHATVLDVPSTGVPWRADLGGARIDRVDLRYHEQGLLAQRNRHCRQRHGEGFIDRHREQLHAWLRELGMVPDEPVWEAYRQWLLSGGELVLSARPARAVGFDEYHRFAPEDRLRLLSLSLGLGAGTPVPVEAVASGVLIAADFTPLPDMPGEPVDYEAEPATSAWSDWPEDGEAAAGPDVLDPFEGGSGIETRIESGVTQADATAAPPTPPRPRLVFRPIEFTDLAERRGERVRITTLGGNRHTGIVLAVTDDALELQISRYGGGARLPIAREQIRFVELMRVE